MYETARATEVVFCGSPMNALLTTCSSLAVIAMSCSTSAATPLSERLGSDSSWVNAA